MTVRKPAYLIVSFLIMAMHNTDLLSAAEEQNDNVPSCPAQLASTKLDTSQTRQLKKMYEALASDLSLSQATLYQVRSVLGQIRFLLNEWFATSDRHDVRQAIELRVEKSHVFDNDCEHENNNKPWDDYCDLAPDGQNISRSAYEAWRDSFSQALGPRDFLDLGAFCASPGLLQTRHEDETGELNMGFRGKLLRTPVSDCADALGEYARTYDRFVADSANEKRLRLRVQKVLQNLHRCYGIVD